VSPAPRSRISGQLTDYDSRFARDNGVIDIQPDDAQAVHRELLDLLFKPGLMLHEHKEGQERGRPHSQSGREPDPPRAAICSPATLYVEAVCRLPAFEPGHSTVVLAAEAWYHWRGFHIRHGSSSYVLRWLAPVKEKLLRDEHGLVMGKRILLEAPDPVYDRFLDDWRSGHITVIARMRHLKDDERVFPHNADADEVPDGFDRPRLDGYRIAHLPEHYPLHQPSPPPLDQTFVWADLTLGSRAQL
jgi:hypothetical protein